MKLELFLLGQSIRFERATARVEKVISPKTGAIFVASTLANDPVLCVSGPGPRPKTEELERQKPKTKRSSPRAGILEMHVLRIPLEGKPWEVVEDKATKISYISIRGPRPTSLPKKAEDLLTIKLDATTGRWRVEPDLSADMLNVSLERIKI